MWNEDGHLRMLGMLEILGRLGMLGMLGMLGPGHIHLLQNWILRP